jgi:hypothetical protein
LFPTRLYRIHIMDWQTVTAGIIVAAAALWLTRRIVRNVVGGLRGDPNHGACGSCPKNTSGKHSESIKVTPLVQLGEKQDS